MISRSQLARLQDMYEDMLSLEFIAERRRDIRKANGRGHARATDWKLVA